MMHYTDPPEVASGPSAAEVAAELVRLAEPSAFVVVGDEAALYSALVDAAGELHNVALDGSAAAGKYSYRYATLGAVMAVVRPALVKHGLAVAQAPVVSAGEATVVTRIIHRSGASIETFVTLRTGPNPSPQEVGSAISYGRRYGLTALLGLATEADDDGAAATEAAGRAVPEVDPFDDPRRDPALVSRETYAEIVERSHALTPAERSELTAWRESLGIKIRPATLTQHEAEILLGRLRPDALDAEFAETADAANGPSDLPGPAGEPDTGPEVGTGAASGDAPPQPPRRGRSARKRDAEGEGEAVAAAEALAEGDYPRRRR